jgi:hypothetical protein
VRNHETFSDVLFFSSACKPMPYFIVESQWQNVLISFHAEAVDPVGDWLCQSSHQGMKLNPNSHDLVSPTELEICL